MVPVLAATTPGHQLLAGPLVAQRTVPYGLSAPKAGLGVLRQRSQNGRAGHAIRGKLTAGPDVQLNDAGLATALKPVVGTDPGQLGVGVVDLTTGASATYQSDAPIRDGGLVTANILAALLLRHQQTGTRLSGRVAELAASMMDGDSTATSQLWALVGGAPGLAAANVTLKLRDTNPMAVGGGSWEWTQTTVADQLQLLADLAGPRSPLRSAYQDYALGLMEGATAHRWDVLAAASTGTPAAVADGSLVGPRWVIGSIGVIQRHGHELLVAVLSDRNPVQGPAATAARAAALAAAALVS